MVKLLTSTNPKQKTQKVMRPPYASPNLLLAMVEERLGRAIVSLRLEVIAGSAPRIVFLENAYCRLILTWYVDDNVVCRFEAKPLADWKALGHVFELHFFLYLQLGAGASAYVPKGLHDGPICRRWLCLDAIHAALIRGELSGPLSGDFSWAWEYYRLSDETDRISDRLLKAMNKYRPELGPIFEKLHIHDPSWLDDARIFLSKQ